MKAVFSKNYQQHAGFIKQCIENFDVKGKVLAEGRNEIRIFDKDAQQFNIKSFRIPNTVNKIAYRFFRKSKAQRSFEYASILEEKGIGTPAPVAYFENPTSIFFRESFYVCKHLQARHCQPPPARQRARALLSRRPRATAAAAPVAAQDASVPADPFVSTGFRTAFTRGAGGRPYQLRGSAGFQRRFLARWVAEFAARGQRDVRNASPSSPRSVWGSHNARRMLKHY